MSIDPERISEPETRVSSNPATEHKSADQVITTTAQGAGSGEGVKQNPAGEDF